MKQTQRRQNDQAKNGRESPLNYVNSCFGKVLEICGGVLVMNSASFLEPMNCRYAFMEAKWHPYLFCNMANFRHAIHTIRSLGHHHNSLQTNILDLVSTSGLCYIIIIPATNQGSLFHDATQHVEALPAPPTFRQAMNRCNVCQAHFVFNGLWGHSVLPSMRKRELLIFVRKTDEDLDGCAT